MMKDFIEGLLSLIAEVFIRLVVELILAPVGAIMLWLQRSRRVSLWTIWKETPLEELAMIWRAGLLNVIAAVFIAGIAGMMLAGAWAVIRAAF